MIIIILPPTHTLKTHLHHVEYERKKEKKVELSFLGGMRGWGGVGVSAPNQHQKMGLRNKKKKRN